MGLRRGWAISAAVHLPCNAALHQQRNMAGRSRMR